MRIPANARNVTINIHIGEGADPKVAGDAAAKIAEALAPRGTQAARAASTAPAATTAAEAPRTGGPAQAPAGAGGLGEQLMKLVGAIVSFVTELLTGLLGGLGQGGGLGSGDTSVSDGTSPVADASAVSDSDQSFSPKKVFVFGNRDYPLSTTLSSQKQVDLSKTMAQEFGGEIFEKLNPEAKRISDRYGELFGKSVVFGEDGSLVGIYDTRELEALNSEIPLYGSSTAVGQTLKTPDGKSFEIADNRYASPLTFDLNGNGKVGTTGVRDGRNFEMTRGATRSAWAEAGDGILAFGNGRDGTEVLGNNAVVGGKTYANGFEALKALAVKHLGKERVAKGYLNKADLLELERKANLHMLVAGETAAQDRKLRPATDLGIERINLTYREAGENADAQGNQHRQVGTGFVQNGRVKAVNDVWYRYH